MQELKIKILFNQLLSLTFENKFDYIKLLTLL
jgi:hypothetical protein